MNRPYLQGGSYHWANADLSWLSDNIKVLGATSSYTPNTAAGGDEFLSAIPGGAIVCTSSNLSGKTNTAGVLAASNVTFASVGSGSTIIQFVIYNDTGSSATSELIAIYDTATNLPVVTNGGNIGLQWAGSPNYVMAFYKKALGKLLCGRGAVIGAFHPQGGLWLPAPTIFQF